VIQRYDLEVDYGGASMERDDTGEYVLWSDIEPLLPRWVPCSERLPEFPKERTSVTVYAMTAGQGVISLDWTFNKYAATERGRKPRWEWRGRIAGWEVTHWLEITLPPIPEERT
jgi:hypothetical protein